MVLGRVEAAIRQHLHNGQHVVTPSKGAPFIVSQIDDWGVTMLFGTEQTRTPLPWHCWEGVVPFLTGRGWVEIGGRYSVEADITTLDGYLKRHMKRATAGWVAAVLEAAHVVEIDRGRPSRVRLTTRS